LQRYCKHVKLKIKITKKQFLLIAALNHASSLMFTLNTSITMKHGISVFFHKDTDSPDSLQSENKTVMSRMWKRLCAETLISILLRPLSKPTVDSKYKEKSMKKYNVFITHMKNHFMWHANWFSTDKAKILNKTECLSDDLLLKWTQHVKNLRNTLQIWNDFINYLLQQINDPKNLTHHIYQWFTDACQKSHQTVQNLTVYMTQLKTLLLKIYSNEQ